MRSFPSPLRGIRSPLGLGAGGGGGGGPSLDPSLTPPVLTLAVGVTTYPPEFDAAIDTTAAVGDTVQLEWTGDIRFGSLVGSASNVIDSAEAAAGEAAFAGLSAIVSPAVYYYRARIVRPNGNFSAWSNTVLHGAAADSTPAAFSFTDQNNVALGVVSESNAITLTGFNQPITGDAAGGQYAVNEGSGFGPWITTAGRTFFPGDQVKVRHTNSASNSTATNTTFTAGGVSDTFTSTTLAAPVSLPTSGLILRLDADDLATLSQTINGLTPVTADGQSVGYWGDKSGGGFHMAAAANDTTRPTYRENGGLPYVEFDGTNDILFRLANLGIWSNGANTILAAVRVPLQASTNRGLIAQRSTSSTNPVYAVVNVASSFPQAGPFVRNDSNTQILANLHFTTTPFDNTDAVLTSVDNGSSILGYDDGVAGTSRSYTRAGNSLTLDVTSIGGWRGASSSSWLQCRIYALAVWNRVLNGTELAQALTYMGSKQGRLL